jgi:hypothetical protein
MKILCFVNDQAHKLTLFAIIILSTICSVTYGHGHVSQLNVKDFGAKGDGISDDYNALIAASGAINKNGGGTLFFPRGTYYIKPYNTQQKKYPNIEFINCNGVNVIGDHAVISVNGNFKRTKDFEAGTHGNGNSYINEVIPLLFTNCKNVHVEGFEINGNVNLMTRDAHLAEGRAHLILLNGCEQVILNNLYLHHAQSDGVYITGKDKPTINVKMYDVVSSNNARQGMSITGLTGGEFTNCRFTNTGETQGSYGYHAPSAGVDIEPRTYKDYKTGNIVFNKCTFDNNIGGQFICTSPSNTSNIVLKNCSIISNAKSSKYTMILSAVGVVVDSCTIDCMNGDIYAKGKASGSSVNILNCTIKSNFSGIRAISSEDVDTLNVNNNKLICTAVSTGKAYYFPYLIMKNLTFINNTIFIPSAIAASVKETSLIQNAIISQGNKFYSDKKNIKPVVSYKGTLNIKDL